MKARKHSSAHHLVAIRKLRDRLGYARVTDVAEELGITRGSASITSKSMQEKGLVSRDPNGFLLLTSRGELLARTTLAKKGRLRDFFHRVLELPVEIVEDEVRKIDHLLSPESAHELCLLMQFLDSGRPEAAAFLEAFQQFRQSEEREPIGECESCGNECLFQASTRNGGGEEI